MAGQSKRCGNEACQMPELPVKGHFCTAGRCKRRRAELAAAKQLVGAGGAAPVSPELAPTAEAEAAC
jgi:hypothetical protein